MDPFAAMHVLFPMAPRLRGMRWIKNMSCDSAKVRILSLQTTDIFDQ
jgi:hypothetical protein